MQIESTSKLNVSGNHRFLSMIPLLKSKFILGDKFWVKIMCPLIFTVFLVLVQSSANAQWTQPIGDGVVGESTFNGFGTNVVLSSNENVLAVASPRFKNTEGSSLDFFGFDVAIDDRELLVGTDSNQEPGGPQSTNSSVYVVDQVESTADVFQDAIIAASGSVTYQANTNITGVLSFDKAQDYWVDLNALQDDLNGTSRSVFMWVKVEDDVAGDNQVLFAINEANGDNRSFLFIDNSGDNLEVNRGGINTQSADYNMGDEQWHYVGYTYDASTNETVIYVDGIENSRASRSQLAVADDQYSLGQEFDGKNDSDHFNGDMAEVSVWNDVLTGGEIREAMKTKITDSHPKYANLVGYYSIFGAYSEDATVLKDHSGKGNDGVMQNGLQVDFKNVQAIEGFNAIDWYTNLSWSKDGSEVSTDAAYTTDVAEGTYTFTATRDFIKATDSWTMTLNSNAATVDEIADETLCADDPITRTVNTNTVNYLDFEEDDENFIDVSEVVDDLVGSNRSIFMWVNKESNVANNDSDVLFSIHTDNGTESVSNLYIKDNERLAIYNGSGNDQGTTSLGNDTWYFVGYTYDATTFETKIYVNGQLENTFTEEMPVIAGGTAFIGMEMDDEGPSDFLDGKLAEVTVWDKVLTQEEVTVLMGAASANNVTNLVASYGTLKNIADNRLFDLSANGNDGLASHETIIVTTEEATLADYDASINYSFSWKKDAAEFDTDAKVNIAIAEGTTNYSVNYGTPFFQKTDVFALSYTNLLPNQPTSKSAGVTGKVTFEVDDISGASYQWYQKGELNGITRLRSTFPSTKYVRDIVYTENKLFVAVEGGLYFSEDLGASWLQVPPNTNGFPAGAFVQSLFYDNGKLYVGTNDGLFKSEDQGLNWETIASGSDITGGTPVAIYASGDNISVTTSSSSGGISISNDGGNTWLKTVSATNTIGFWSAQNLKSLGLIGDNVFVGSGSTTGLAVSRDGGASWSVLGEPEGVFGKVLGMDVDGMHIYLATDLGLHISEDAGLTWAKGPGILEDAWLLDVVVEGDRLFAIENTNFIISDSDGGNATRYSNSSIGTNGGFLMLDASQDNFFIGPSENSTQLVSIVNDIVALQDQTDNTALNQIQGATTHQLTINNLSLDQNQSEYYVVVSKDGCEQISNQITLTVLDVPGIESISPAASSSDVAIDVPVVITFNRDITKGSGNIRIVDHATDSEIQSFSVDQTDLSGRILTLPSASLANDTRYYITIDEGIVLDISSNKNLAVTDKEKYSFTTVCEPLVLTQPADQIGAVTGSATFSVPEVTGASYQWFQEGGIGEIDEPITNMPAPSDATRIVRAMSSSNSRLFVVFWSGGFSNSTSVLSYSENEGATWTEVVGGENGFSSQEVSDVYADGNKIYVGHKALGHFNGKLSISEDGGNSWEIIEYTDTNGFTRGSINAVFAIGNKLFVGEGNTGLLISEDGGENWRTVAAGENGTLSTNIQSIYAEGNNVYVVAEGGLSISTDGGTNWTSDSNQNGLGGGPIFSKVFVDGNNVYVGAGSGFNISNDGGNTWRKLSTSEMGFATSSSVKGIYADGDKIYVGVFNENGGLTVSEDGGQTWTTFSTTGENQLTLSNEVLSMTEHQGSVYIGVRGGIEVLVPKTKLTNVTDQSSANQITGADSRELTINNLTLDLDQSQFSVVVTKGNCEETSDLATLTVAEAPVLASFTPALNATDVALDTDITLTFNLPVTKGTGSIRIKKADDDTEVAAFAVTSQSVSLTDKTLTVSLGATTLDYATTYYVTLDADVVKDGSDQGNPAVIDKTAISFTTVCPNLITEQPTSQSSTVGGSATFSVPEVDGASYQWYQSGAGEFVSTNGGYGAFSVSVVGESVYAAISGAGLQISKDGGATWSFTKSGDNGFASSDLVGTVYAENNTVYAGTYGGGLSISSDGGLNWTTHLISKLGLQSSTINSVFAEGNIVYAGTSEGVSISNDGGVFWTTTTNGENGFALSGNVNTVYAKNDVIYAGTAMGISISTDGGATWSTTTNGQNGFASSDKVNSVFAAGNKVYAGTSGGISISNDGGVSWTTTTSGQNGFALSDKVNSVFATGQKVYAGTDKGLSVSTDGGASWSTTTAGQNGFPAIDQILAVNEINGTLYIGSRGLYTQEMYSLLENVSDESSTNQITGVDTRELTVNNLMTDFDQSKFFVVVSKGNCEETSELATLTVTVQGPDILMVSPANGVSNLFPSSLNTVSSSSNKFTLTLTENIKYGNVDAEYKLYTADNDELVASQSLISTQTGPLVNSPRATFGFYDYSFEYGKSYYILIDAGMLKSDATDADFAGITDKTVWAFSTISDETRPTINTLSPAAGATNVSIADISITQDELNTATSTDDTDQFTIVFNERITFGANSTTTTFKLYKAEGDELLSEQTTFDLALRGPNIKSSDPNTFIFRFVDVVFEPATEYYIQIDEGAVVNFDTTLPFAGISDKTTWSFTTEVAEAETFEFTGTFPADDQTDVPLGISTTDPFVGTGFEGFFTGHIISFENKIKSGVAGKISLYKASDNSLVHEINTANDPIIIQENINSTVGEVYIGGFGETGLMINADITLEPQREYYWLIDQGIVEYSESSAVFAGISDPTVWNFTTGIGENTEGITIVSQTPENNATDVSINPVLEFTFKTGTVQEDLITANTGSIKIKKVSDDTEAAVVDVTSDKVRVSFEVTTTYITNVSVSFEDASLEPNTEYYVEISPEAFKDQKGGFYSGISDKTTWSFTTGQAQNTEGHFITTWETTGASEAISITLGNTSGATFQPHNYSIDWGDGSEVETGVSADVSHTYAEPGIHTVKISGEFYQISLGSDLNNAKKLRTIEQWGAIVWKDLSRAFEGCENLVINANDQPNLSEVTSLVYTFKNATNFNADLSGWDVSNVTKMSGMFDGASAFNQDLSSWDVSAVRDMGDMFSGATSFNGDVSTWDVSSVGSMANMFKGASAFNQELSSWDVSSVRDMLYMFSDATSFTSDLSDWDVSSVTQIIGMFNKAAAFNSDLSAWNISSSITSTSYMFGGATNFSSNLSGWDMSSVTDLSYMFYSASSFNGDLSGWDVSSVSDMNFVFWDATSFKSDLSTWDVSSATRMSAMFMGASVFTSDLSSWDVSSVIFMSNMFEGASVFNSDLSGWEVSSVTSMSNMFDRASMFTSDLSGWDVSLVTSMGSMFEGASMFNSDLSGWDVSRVTNMGSMFKGASMFTSDLSSWDVSLVTNMSSMFEGASLFTSDLSSWDVSSVSLMNSMFEGASSFNSDLSSWNLVSVKTIENMLKGAAISVVNYDAILRGWGANSLTPTRLRFGEVSSSYCDADASNFFRRKRWIYTDQGQDCLELVTLLPANNAAGVLVQPEISITFDEVIVKGTGDIILYNTLDDSEVVRISVESTLVGVDGTTTTIRLGDLNLDFGTSYYFLVPETAFKNEADLYFQGITDKTTWSFTTAEENVGLSISSLIPTNGSIDVSLSAVNSAFPGNNRFWITFNEGVKNGNTSAEYRLYKADNDELVASQTFISTQSGPSFNNTSTGLGFYNYSFEKGTSYYILMDAGMFKSISSDEEFAGITDKNVWSFTTEAEPLLVKSTDPNSDEAVNLDDAFITINFDEEIAIGVGAFTIYRALDNSVFETIDVSNFNIINNGITGFANVDLSQNWEIGVDYYVQYPNGLFTSLDGAKKIKAVIDKISYTIQAERFAESIFTAFYPANGSVNYKVDSGDDFVISLSEDVYGNGRPPIGALRIYKAANDELIKTFQLRGDFQQGENEGDLNDYDDNDNIEDKIYISVGDVLEPSTEYYILIDDGFVISYDEELYHLGISDKNTWRFTTLDLPSTPVLSATTPVNNASDVATNTALILEFSENMVASQGNINVYAANGNLLETKEAIAATTSGAKVTIRLTNELSNSETYYVLIDADAFESTNGVAFAGISDDQVFRFTTAAAGNKVPTVSNQNFTGRLEVNQQLTGSYTYTDADSDPESGTTLQWYVADNAAGANKAPVSGANAINYTLTTSEVGKFLALGITPNDGKDAGTEAFTDYQGPVLAAVIPTLVSTVPADGALDVAVDANLTLTLSETVTKGTGNIVLTPTSGTATQVAVTSSDVSISGAVVTINPTADLLEGQFYTVTFDATAFVDADGNNSAGLSSQTTWNFTTKEANVAPVATGVTLKKSLVVDGVLEGSYTYTDANGDVEAGTTFKWYRADDVNGTNKAEITGATTGSYTIVNGDNGKFISFEVTPNDGALSGTPSESVFFGPILINDGNTNIPPAFTSDALTSIKDNENYSYTITYEDLNSDVPVLTKTTGPAWLSVSGFVLSGSPTASNIGDHQVVLTLDDQKGGTVTQAFTVTVIQSNTAPSVSGVELAGTTTIDQVLTGSYNFIDAEQDTDNSTFKWYRSDDTSGSNKAEINSATSTTYTLTTADADKYISFQVTPNDGTINGTTGESALLGPIGKKTPSLSLAGITKVYGDAAFDLSATTNSSGTVTYSFDNDQTGANLSDVRVTLGNVGQITVNVSLAADAEY
ncbi:MAG: BspA family leucine-rich repeat surface protein, partial [Cyclobacteriaceae bacterium]